jgi:hypothetical protein
MRIWQIVFTRNKYLHPLTDRAETTGKEKINPRWPAARTGVKPYLQKQKLSPARRDYYDLRKR